MSIYVAKNIPPDSYRLSDEDEPCYEECYDEAKRRYKAERYPATPADIVWRAKAIFEGEEQ